MPLKPAFALVVLTFTATSSVAVAQITTPAASLDQGDAHDLMATANRNRTMLHQARFILELSDTGLARWDLEDSADPVTIATAQVRLAEALSADAVAACGQDGIPDQIRNAGCALASASYETLRHPAALDVASLSVRADTIDDLVGYWWDAACALSPEPAIPSEAVCVLE